MEQAKWYDIVIRYEINHSWNQYFKQKFKWLVLLQCLKDDDLNRAKLYFVHERIKIFCGKKKLKKLIEEAHLLGLEDELLIFERKGENKNG